MDGVEILNQTIVYATEYCWHIIWIMAVIMGVLAFLIEAFSYGVFCVDRHCIAGSICGVLFGVVFGILLMIQYPAHVDEIDYIAYQVTLSDDVNFNEFREKYEIIDQNGEIYTVREKE